MTVTPAAPELTGDFTPEQLELQERARRFVEDILIPNEEQAELAGGHIPAELKQRIKDEAVAARLSGGLHSPEYGGQGWTKTEWFLVEEQLGRSTNALSWHMPGAYNVLANGTPEQIDRYLRPALRGELHDAYAVTEAEAGSDPSKIETTARRTDGGWVIDGEKWFVTYGDIAAVYIVMANAARGRPHAAHAVPGGPRHARDRGGGRSALHPHLSTRPPHDPLQRGGGA